MLVPRSPQNPEPLQELQEAVANSKQRAEQQAKSQLNQHAWTYGRRVRHELRGVYGGLRGQHVCNAAQGSQHYNAADEVSKPLVQALALGSSGSLGL